MDHLYEAALQEREKAIREKRESKYNMTIGEILPGEEWRRDSTEKNKLYFFLMSKGLMEEYIDFCSQSRADWAEVLTDMTTM